MSRIHHMKVIHFSFDLQHCRSNEHLKRSGVRFTAIGAKKRSSSRDRKRSSSRDQRRDDRRHDDRRNNDRSRDDRRDRSESNRSDRRNRDDDKR